MIAKKVAPIENADNNVMDQTDEENENGDNEQNQTLDTVNNVQIMYNTGDEDEDKTHAHIEHKIENPEPEIDDYQGIGLPQMQDFTNSTHL